MMTQSWTQLHLNHRLADCSQDAVENCAKEVSFSDVLKLLTTATCLLTARFALSSRLFTGGYPKAVFRPRRTTHSNVQSSGFR